MKAPSLKYSKGCNTMPDANLPSASESPVSKPNSVHRKVEPERTGTAVRFEKTFASYAREDSAEVLKRIDMAATLGVKVYFDRESLNAALGFGLCV
jgi:hypothetical protein